jgi:hypothetical protein
MRAFSWMRVSRLAPAGVVLALLAGVALGAAACAPGINGSGHVKTESRVVSGFSSVVLNGVGTLSITQTGTESLSITTDDNILPLITSTVSNGTLTLSIKPGNSLGQLTQLSYKLTVATLRGLTVSGAATVTASGINADSLTLTLNGAATLTGTNITASTLAVTLNGASSVTISGQGHTQKISMSGASKYDGSHFTTHSATVSVSGAGDVSVAASDTLDVTISGAGTVTYYGSPHLTQHINGAGTIKQG